METDRLAHVVREAVRGGVSAVQLREKDIPTREFVARARMLMEILKPLKIPLIINDRVDVALAADADGVHVGQSDMDPRDARRLMPGRIVGLSVESHQQALDAEELDVDYIGVSPVFATLTKTDTIMEWGLDGVAWLKANCRHPLVAIGGITLNNTAAIVQAGADSIAVVSGICSASDPFSAAESYSRIIRNTERTRP